MEGKGRGTASKKVFWGFDRRVVLGIHVMLSIAVLSGTFGCSVMPRRSSPPPHPGKPVYINSFESPRDTLRWFWVGKHDFSTDVPPGGGNFALELKGDKLIPSAGFITRPLPRGGYFVIECWGKTVNVGGYIELSAVHDHEIVNSIRINILDYDWRHVQSPDTLYCPPNHSLMFTVQSGVYVDGVLRVDKIIIRKVFPRRPSIVHNTRRR